MIESPWLPQLTDDFSHFVGPVLERLEDGKRIFAFQADRRHANDLGIVHGGMLVTFADQAFGELVLDSIGQKPCATIQLNTQFIGAVQIGDFVEGRGEIVRVTRSLVFVRGMLSVGGRTVAAIDGIWKVLYDQGRQHG
jgi:uncharacterized protein (TIGR00369 family)